MGLTDAHVAAIEYAYELVESAQGELSLSRIDEIAAGLVADDWPDIHVLLHFARSLATRHVGLDDSHHVQAMLDSALSVEDPALLALALATSALRRTTDAKRATPHAEGALVPFVRAVGLLDTVIGPVVHRVAAQIEVGQVAHLLGYWEIALERYELAERALQSEDDPRWAGTTRRQHVVNVVNRVDLVLDWCSALAMIDDWQGAAGLAATVLPDARDHIGDDWPPSWVVQYRQHLGLLEAIAGAGPGEGPIGRAVRLARDGDYAGAARLVDGLADRSGIDIPRHTRLLAMSLAARGPDTPPNALRYADELARLRWNDRLDRMANLRDALAVERRRLEHEQLRRDILTDELTGLANRRGYHAYLTGVLQSPDEGEYAVMMIDVDHFKAVNDNFGHDVGDLVLAAIADILSAAVRPSDLAARLGGDEFLIILAQVRADLPQARAQLIVDAVRDYPWDELAPGLAVSISVGVHQGGPDKLANLAADADRRLYQAKSDGRGRVAV